MDVTSVRRKLAAQLPRVLTGVYRPVFRWAARKALEERLFERTQPERGRWGGGDVDEYLDDVWSRVEQLLPDAHLDRLPTVGNRHNVFLAVVTTAAYQVMAERSVERDYAMELSADIVWNVYAGLLRLAALPAHIVTRDPQRRIEWTLRPLMLFPFSAPGRPGYEAEVWSEGDRFFTYWTHCPPQTLVRDLTTRRGDRGELEAFYRSWCQYDWPGADLLAGDGERGHYERRRTLSRGDSVCDMCWKRTATQHPPER